MKVLVIGSVNIDTTLYVNRFPNIGETLYGNKKISNVGGKGANQAVALARSGVDTTFLCAAGHDNDAQEIKRVLEKEHMKLIMEECDLQTGTALIMVDDKADNEIILSSGANQYFDESNLIKYDSLIKESDYIVLQGEISHSANRYIILKAHEFGKKVIFNPAPYKNKLEADLFGKIDYITPNEGELSLMTPKLKDASIEERCEALLNKGVKNVVVTLGEQGALFMNKDEMFKVDAFKVDAIDTVAAGDTFNGYFVSALMNNKTNEDAIIIANKASSLAVLKKGALPSVPYKEDIKLDLE